MKKLIKNKKIVLLAILLGIFYFYSTVLAGEINWPKSPGGTVLNPDSSTITDLVKYLYEWGIALGGLAAFIALLIAGFLYLTSVGDPVKMAEAKDRIYWALGGLVFLLASWLILNTINPKLTDLTEPSFSFDDTKNLGECEKDEDCRIIQSTNLTGQTINQNIGGENCKCYGDTNKDDHIKEGTCFCEEEEVINCDYVIIYPEPGFTVGDNISSAMKVEKIRGTGAENGAGCVKYGFRWGAFEWGQLHAGSSQGGMDKPDGRIDGKSYVYVISDSGKEIRIEGIELDNCLEMKDKQADISNAISNQDQKLKGKPIICKQFNCVGWLQLFHEENCTDMITQLPPTNSVISVENTIHSVKFVTSPPENATSTPGGGGGGGGGGGAG